MMEQIKNYFFRLLELIDNGRYLIRPFKWMYLMNAILSWAPAVFFIVAVIGQLEPSLRYTEGWTKIVCILGIFIFFVFLLFVGYLGFLFWTNRKKRIDDIVKEGDSAIAIPLFADWVKCIGESCGMFLGLVIPIGLIVLYMFFLLTGYQGFYKDGTFIIVLFAMLGIIVVCEIASYFIILINRYISERIKIFGQMANDLHDVADIHRAVVEIEE